MTQHTGKDSAHWWWLSTLMMTEHATNDSAYWRRLSMLAMTEHASNDQARCSACARLPTFHHAASLGFRAGLRLLGWTKWHRLDRGHSFPLLRHSTKYLWGLKGQQQGLLGWERIRVYISEACFYLLCCILWRHGHVHTAQLDSAHTGPSCTLAGFKLCTGLKHRIFER